MRHMDEIAACTILYGTNSWFMGTNIPKKKRAILLYADNTATYQKEYQEAAAKGYEGHCCKGHYEESCTLCL